MYSMNSHSGGSVVIKSSKGLSLMTAPYPEVNCPAQTPQLVPNTFSVLHRSTPSSAVPSPMSSGATTPQMDKGAPLDLSLSHKRRHEDTGDGPLDLSMTTKRQKCVEEDDVIILGVQRPNSAASTQMNYHRQYTYGESQNNQYGYTSGNYQYPPANSRAPLTYPAQIATTSYNQGMSSQHSYYPSNVGAQKHPMSAYYRSPSATVTSPHQKYAHHGTKGAQSTAVGLPCAPSHTSSVSQSHKMAETNNTYRNRMADWQVRNNNDVKPAGQYHMLNNMHYSGATVKKSMVVSDIKLPHVPAETNSSKEHSNKPLSIMDIFPKHCRSQSSVQSFQGNEARQQPQSQPCNRGTQGRYPLHGAYGPAQSNTINSRKDIPYKSSVHSPGATNASGTVLPLQGHSMCTTQSTGGVPQYSNGNSAASNTPSLSGYHQHQGAYTKRHHDEYSRRQHLDSGACQRQIPSRMAQSELYQAYYRTSYPKNLPQSSTNMSNIPVPRDVGPVRQHGLGGEHTAMMYRVPSPKPFHTISGFDSQMCTINTKLRETVLKKQMQNQCASMHNPLPVSGASVKPYNTGPLYPPATGADVPHHKMAATASSTVDKKVMDNNNTQPSTEDIQGSQMLKAYLTGDLKKAEETEVNSEMSSASDRDELSFRSRGSAHGVIQTLPTGIRRHSVTAHTISLADAKELKPAKEIPIANVNPIIHSSKAELASDTVLNDLKQENNIVDSKIHTQISFDTTAENEDIRKKYELYGTDDYEQEYSIPRKYKKYRSSCKQIIEQKVEKHLSEISSEATRTQQSQVESKPPINPTEIVQDAKQTPNNASSIPILNVPKHRYKIGLLEHYRLMTKKRRLLDSVYNSESQPKDDLSPAIKQDAETPPSAAELPALKPADTEKAAAGPDLPDPKSKTQDREEELTKTTAVGEETGSCQEPAKQKTRTKVRGNKVGRKRKTDVRPNGQKRRKPGRRKQKVKKRKRKEVTSLVLPTRTRSQSAAQYGVRRVQRRFHKNAAYEEELRREESRKLLLRFKRRDHVQPPTPAAVSPRGRPCLSAPIPGRTIKKLGRKPSRKLPLTQEPAEENNGEAAPGEEGEVQYDLGDVPPEDHQGDGLPAESPVATLPRTPSRKYRRQKRKLWYKRAKRTSRPCKLPYDIAMVQLSDVSKPDCRSVMEEVMGLPPLHADLLVESRKIPSPDKDTNSRRLAVCRDVGETQLHRAARQGYEDIVQHYITSKTIDVNVQDNAKYTPLHESCVRGHFNIARHLLAAGANPNASAQDGTRPIHDAVDSDNVELVRLLLACGAHPDIATYSGKTTMKLARSEKMRTFLNGLTSDLKGTEEDEYPWEFRGTDFESVSQKYGYVDILNDALDDQDTDCDLEQLAFECCERPLLTVYNLASESGRSCPYHLLEDVISDTGKTMTELQEVLGTECLLSLDKSAVWQKLGNASVLPRSAFMALSAVAGDTLHFVRVDDRLKNLLDVEVIYIQDAPECPDTVSTLDGVVKTKSPSLDPAPSTSVTASGCVPKEVALRHVDRCTVSNAPPREKPLSHACSATSSPDATRDESTRTSDVANEAKAESGEGPGQGSSASDSMREAPTPTSKVVVETTKPLGEPSSGMVNNRHVKTSTTHGANVTNAACCPAPGMRESPGKLYDVAAQRRAVAARQQKLVNDVCRPLKVVASRLKLDGDNKESTETDLPVLEAADKPAVDSGETLPAYEEREMPELVPQFVHSNDT